MTDVALPKDWPRHVRLATLKALGIAHFGMTFVRGWCADSRIARVRLVAETERLGAEVNLLNEELRILQARLARIPPRQRPHYPPPERMAILQLRVARGWSLELAARRLLITAETLTSWTRRAADDASDLVALKTPVNKLPEFVGYLVKTLKALVPSMGKVRIAQHLARAGLHLHATTVRRLLRKEAPTPEPLPPQPEKRMPPSGRTVTAKRPNHVWNIDLTTVPTSGTALPWHPGAVPPVRPHTWWVLAIVDHFSRRLVGFAVFHKEPTGRDVHRALDRAISRVGVAPTYTVTDQGVQFGKGFKAWCKRRRILPRFGAIGRHGSIAVTERFILTFKDELLRRILVPMDWAGIRRALVSYGTWYNAHRPHRALAGATPLEVYAGTTPAHERPRLEVRPHFPVGGKIRGDPGAVLHLRVSGMGGGDPKIVPLVELRRTA